MYQFAYSEIVEESPLAMRAGERGAMDRVIAMLRRAQEKGAGAPESIEALFYLGRLWTIFMNDLSNPENELPEQMRRGILSIGIWMRREIDRLRRGDATDLTPLIEINEIIRDGLK